MSTVDIYWSPMNLEETKETGATDCLIPKIAHMPNMADTANEPSR